MKLIEYTQKYRTKFLIEKAIKENKQIAVIYGVKGHGMSECLLLTTLTKSGVEK
jgi:hypothetical protein